MAYSTFFRQITSFSDSFHYTKKQKKKPVRGVGMVGSFNYFSYTVQIESNWHMDSGVCDLEIALFKVNST